MSSYITSLPTRNHHGESTLNAVYGVCAALRAANVAYNVTPDCKGYWYDGDVLYADDTVLLHMDGDEKAIRRALAWFGEMAEQYEVLLVAQVPGYVVAKADGVEGATRLAATLGGATLFPNGIAVSYRYAALVHGRDYASTVTAN